MPIRAELQQLEKCIDNALRKNDFKPLERFLQMENYEDITLKCSKQFFSKLDNLMCKELNKKDIQNTSTILNSLGKYGKNISIFGETGLLVMIKQGLVKKITWFEKTKDIILSHKKEKDEAMTNLIEDFFDVLMTVHDINKEGKIEVLENFILRICALVVDMRIHMCIQQEAIKKLNVMLDGMPRDAKKIISKREMLSLMIDMGKRILDAGDYDFQVAITEALCRMTSEKQRRELASQWFPMEFIATAFKKIKDSDFETDCRKFLNHVNGMLGDKRLVFTFPCLSVFLDRYELQIPSDEKLDDFWIDFNLGSQSISFYISGDDEDHQWEAVNVSNDEVEKYNVEVKDTKKILTLFLKTTMNVGNKKGDQLVFYFDHLLDILDVTKQIYGTNKYREFTKKQAISVAKTAVHIIFDESGSQILMPESQSSPAKIENSFKVDEKPKQQFSENQKDMIHNANQQDLSNTHFQMITPIKRKMSEASMIIPGTDKLTLKTLLADTSTPQTRKVKPPLKMVNSAEPTSIYKVKEKEVKNTTSLSGSVEGRNSQSYQSDLPKSQPVTAAEAIEMVESDENSNMLGKQNSNGDVDIIPDSQPVGKIDKTLFPTVLDNSYESNILLKWTCWTPVKNIKISSKESADTSPEETFNQDFLSERVTDKSSPSISENIALEKNTASENLNQILDLNQKRKGDVEYSKKKKTEMETCETNRRQPLNSISLDQKNIEENKENDWHIESETIKSVLLNRTIEKSLIYTKKLVLAKELNNDCCDKTISSGINAKSNRRPMKGMTSESRSCDLETNRKKEKTKGKHFTDAAESLIDQINKRYNQKDDLNFSRKFRDSLNERRNSNKPGLLIRKEKILNKNSRQLKRTTSVKMTSECALNDVYNFQLNGADDPTIRLGTEEFQTTIKESSITNSKKSLGLRSHDGNEAFLKEKDKKTRTNHRKHLFSDTDTDYRGDDSKTDISWLKESNKKPKPQLVDYSRNKKVKKPQNMRSSLSGEVKLPKSKKAQNTDLKVDQRITETTRPQRPRRAGLVKKNYKDFSNSESESEEESLPVVLSKEKLEVQVTNMRNKSKTTKQLKKGQHAISAETQEEISKGGKKSSEVKDYIREKRLDSSPIPLSGSPASIEIMRCSQKTIEKEFPQDYIASQKFASPFSQNSTPERTESVNSSVLGITGNSFYAANVRIESKCLMQSPENIDENLMFTTNKHFSSPLFLPKINSVIMDKFDDSGKDLEIPYQNIQDYDISMDLSSYDSEKQISGSELKKIHENFILCSQKEPLSPSQFSLSSSKREKLYDISIDILHQKGSNIHTNLKRLCTSDNLSNSDEMELEEEEERRQNLLPPKLIKTDSDHVTYKVSGSISTLSANEFSFPGETWETQSSGVDIMCQKLNKEFKKKIQINNLKMNKNQAITYVFQNQCQKMDYFNRLSLKSAEQHLTSINDHIYEYRMKQLNKFQFNMMEELENFEKDSQSLKNLEREFSDFWKKTCQKLGAYKKNEQKRAHLLKTSFEKNVSHNIEYEENIFTSEMYLMKEEMKRLQEKLLKEMQEEELHNVRRGLMSLFTSNERKF